MFVFFFSRSFHENVIAARTVCRFQVDYRQFQTGNLNRIYTHEESHDLRRGRLSNRFSICLLITSRTNTTTMRKQFTFKCELFHYWASLQCVIHRIAFFFAAQLLLLHNFVTCILFC